MTLIEIQVGFWPNRRFITLGSNDTRLSSPKEVYYKTVSEKTGGIEKPKGETTQFKTYLVNSLLEIKTENELTVFKRCTFYSFGIDLETYIEWNDESREMILSQIEDILKYIFNKEYVNLFRP